MTIELRRPATEDDVLPIFEALDAIVGLTLKAKTVVPVISAARLYRFATEADYEDAALERALDGDTRLRARFADLLGRTAPFALPQLAAASSGEIATREGPGYRIRLQPSQAEPSQTYIVFEFDESAGAAPRTVFVCRPNRAPLRQRLPDAIGGVVQLLADSGSPLLQGLRDLDSEVFLR